MFRLIAVTLAALYAILYIFGDPDRLPAEVARAETPGLSLRDFAGIRLGVNDSPALPGSEISDAEAIRIALEAGARARADQTTDRRGSVAEQSASANATTVEPETDYRYVTASRVNLRGGPGTSTPVVGQVGLGAQAEVIEDRDGWYRIRLTDGGSGWIYGKFLGERQPG